jgi:hypothetical protein
MSASRQSISKKISEHAQPKITYVLLFVAVVASLVALGLALKNKTDISNEQNQINALKSNSSILPENFANANMKVAKGEDYSSYNSDPARLKHMRGENDWWSNNNNNSNTKVYDGMDAANKINGGAAQSQCGPVATAEPAHPNLSAYSGAPSMYNSALANSTAYPDDTAAQSLAGKTTYSCAPDITNVGGCDYAINPDNLMPGSWREGVSCSDGTDPNSQWAKYHPTRDKYYRYITAAGSARLSANTRSSSRKILGLQNPLRSGTSTPITNSMITPFSESSLRSQAIFDATGIYPTATHC